MSKTKEWFWISYDYAPGHMVSGELLAAVRADMDRQDPPGVLRRCIEHRSLYIDQGGMMCVDRPNEIFDFYGLEITVPSEDLGDLIDQWRSAPTVMSEGMTFHRFRSNGRCLVVSADILDEMLSLLQSRADVAEGRSAAFYASRATPQEALRKINESRGAMVQYGADKLGRFRYS
jgi:hypothetical protein